MAAREFKSKNAARRAAKKQQKSISTTQFASNDDTVLGTGALSSNIADSSDPVDVDTKSVVVHDSITDPDDPLYAEFQAVFNRFQAANSAAPTQLRPGEALGRIMDDENDYIPMEEEMKSDAESEEEEKQLSKTKMKKQNRLTVAELKQLVKRPEVVEWTDVSAPDPKLLISLKSVRNAVPVPSHWSQKRDYLSGKRGLEKTNFELPDFIRMTGVGEMRQAAAEQREQQSLKQQMRARVQPKMGSLNADFQKYHDAFFIFQTKPPLTKYGETYYEGKEYETNTKEKRPGELSEELKDALNIPPGAPPPWLIRMQTYGPPPSYPSLKIPGLNAPIPSGARWGFEAGFWGRAPVNEHNKPLYGDVFGVLQAAPSTNPGVPKETELWGELEVVEEDEEEEEEEEEEESTGDNESVEQNVDGEAMTDGMQTGMQTGMASMAPSGIATPDHIELRKARADEERDEDETRPDDDVDFSQPRQPYQVLSERRQDGKGFLQGSHTYVIPAAPVTLDGKQPKKRAKGDVDISIDPETLETGMSKEALEALYDKSRAEQFPKPSGWDQDLSDMVSEQAAQAQKRQKLRHKPEKKEKFKF